MRSHFARNPGRSKSLFTRLKCAAMALAAAMVIATPGAASAKQDYSGIVIDARTGKTLYEHRADSRAFPASLTKMMTLYVVFDLLERKKLSLNTPLKVSSNAASKSPSKLYLKAGSSISVENAIKALVTKSANDVATTIAENIGGTEQRFAEIMTAKARSIGMKSTTFRNASGLPDSRQVTSARDMARLGIALREHFPRYYKYFSTRSFTYAGKRHGNHNRLLGSVSGVDGIKTGYTRASGFNLVSSVQRDGRSIVAVVMGGRTSSSRDSQMRSLIAQYIGKASRSGSGDLIAKGKSAIEPQAVVASASLPNKNAPVPTGAPRNISEAPAVMAYADAPTPPAPIPSVDETVTASVAADGWMIQVAALGSTSEAKAMLAKVKSRAAKAVGGAQPVIQVFEKGGTTYHRARFAGFSSKADANAACKALKKASFNCYAVNG